MANSICRAITLGIACLMMINHVVVAQETIFDVTTYGAKGDGRTDDAAAFIKTWRAACDSTVTPRIVVPGGKVYALGETVFSGPCTAKPPITIEINGNLSAVSDPSVYKRNIWFLIDVADGVEVTGEGTFNGNGPNLWQYATESNRLPVSLTMQEVTNSKLSNLRFVDAMGFHSKVIDSVNVVVTNVTIIAPGESPNTDGIHLTNNTNLNVTDAFIGTGDDCVSIGDGNNNVLITRVQCGPGHGLSIGSLGKRVGETSVSGISIIDCTLTKTTNGARIKTYHASPKMDASGIVFQDLEMNEVKNPIIIDQHYFSKSSPEQSSVQISDVKFINIKGTTTSELPILLNCSTTFPCENILFRDINLTPLTPLNTFESACSSAKFVVEGTVNPAAPAACA